MLFKKKYKFDNTNTLLLLGDNRKIKRQYSEVDIANRVLDHVKRNKSMYFKLVVTIALFIDSNNNYVFANAKDSGNDVAWEVIHMIMVFAKWGCLGRGIMNMTQEMLQGANLKEAISEGIQYFIFYIVLNLYPRIYDMVTF